MKKKYVAPAISVRSPWGRHHTTSPSNR